jgi:DNA-binding NarL/FixJ family response regulator
LKTILQVDDDANDVFLLRHAMRKVGVLNPVQVVKDGQQAIDYLQGAGKFADRMKFPFPTLLLMDLKLPYVMGLDVLRWIRTQPRTPLIVVMLTASAEAGDITEAYRLGANAFLTKPSEAGKLEDMVKAINAFWLIHNTMAPDPSPELSPQRMFAAVPEQGTVLIDKNLVQGDRPSDPARNGNGLLGSLFRKASSTPKRSLTKRQTQVAKLIAEGYSSRQIAHQLAVTIKTVEKHRQAVMDRLDVHGIASLTRYAISIGLVQSSPSPISGSGTLTRWHPLEAPADIDAHARNRS